MKREGCFVEERLYEEENVRVQCAKRRCFCEMLERNKEEV